MDLRPSRLGPLMLLALGCQSESEFRERPETAEDEVLFIEASPSHLTRLNGPHRPSRDDAPIRVEVDDVDSLRFLAVKLGELEAREPLFDPERWRELDAQRESESCTHGRLLEDGRVNVALDDRLSRWLPSDPTSPAPSIRPDDGLSLSFPTDDDRCLDHAPLELRPFGRRANLLPVGTVIQDREVSALDADDLTLRLAAGLTDGRVIAASSQYLFVMEPGRDWMNLPTQSWWTGVILSPTTGARYVIRRLVVDRLGSSGGQVRLVLALSLLEADSRFLGARLVELEWSTAGFGPFRILAELDSEVDFLGADATGRVLVLGEAGLLLVEPPGEREFAALARPDLAGLSLRAWVHTNSVEEPDVFLEGNASLWFGDLDDQAPFRREPTSLLSLSPRRLAARVDSSGTDVYYTSGSPEITRRRPTGERERFSDYMPLRGWPCETVSDECGPRSFGGAVTSYIARSPRDTLILVSSSCSAILEFDPVRGCSRPIHPMGLASGALAGEYIVGFDVDDQGLLISGQEGLLLEARWR